MSTKEHFENLGFASKTSPAIAYAISEIATSNRDYDAILTDPTEAEEHRVHEIARSAMASGLFPAEPAALWAGCETDLIHTSYDDARARGE